MINLVLDWKMNSKTNKTIDIVFIALMAGLISVCSWISIPFVVPFTLQTLGVFCALGILGGKKATIAVLVYIAMGAVGLPVFAGFTGGVGVLMGSTGGYIIGFLASALVYWLVTKLLGNKTWQMIVGMVLGLIACYAFGTAWFMVVYSSANGAVGLWTALTWCVFPFIIPDLAKIGVALLIIKMVPKNVRVFN